VAAFDPVDGRSAGARDDGAVDDAVVIVGAGGDVGQQHLRTTAGAGVAAVPGVGTVATGRAQEHRAGVDHGGGGTAATADRAVPVVGPVAAVLGAPTQVGTAVDAVAHAAGKEPERGGRAVECRGALEEDAVGACPVVGVAAGGT